MAKVGKILLAVVQIGAIIALNYFAPGLGAAITGAAIGSASATFAASIIVAVGTVAIALGGALLSQALFGRSLDMGRQKINVRLEEATRWICAGPVLQGGACVFAEVDSGGNLWWIIVHCDSILTSTPAYYLDNNLVTVNASNDVTTSDFTDDGKIYWKIWTHTYTESDPVPSAATELAAAFPSKWPTVSHMLVGTTYSVMRGRAIKLRNRYKVYKWRGPLGLGEPNLAIFADWSNMYDPRDETQTLGDRTTYKPSRNLALIWAWWRTHPFGRKKSESDVNWDIIATEADICDESVVGIESTQARYECAVAAPDNTDRVTVENNILLAGDAQLMFDDDGKTYIDVGDYEAPTLSFGRNRDIITMASVEAQDGESETQGVIVRYTDHNANYTMQPSAPWYNPNYYVSGEGVTFLKIDIPTCFNHNQAMRLAKSVGLRSQPTHKIGPTVGLRGIRALQERIVDIVYDNQFAGDYEIMSPVEVDESGMFCTLGLVPIDASRFDLLTGEELPRPASSSSAGSVSLSLPTGVTIGYNNGRIEASFDSPPREDILYEFQYIAQADWTDTSADQWADMSVDMDTLFAYSGAVDSGVAQYIRWRTVTPGGASTAWYDPPYSLGAVVPTLSSPTNFAASDGTGEVVITWRNPNDVRFDHVIIYRFTSDTFGSATDISGDITGALGANETYTDTVAAGTYYYWLIAYNSDESISSATIGSITGTSS